jgi:outer membrane protein assembly factor BamA
MFMRLRHFVVLAYTLIVPFLLNAQTATLREIHAEGLKTLTDPQITSLAGLTPGAQVSREDLQAAADALVRSGLFAKVDYNFGTHNDALTVNFKLEENARIPVSFDNFPWYADSELNDAIRKDLPFYDGKLPESGTVVERAAKSLQDFLASKGATVQIEHAVVISPLSEGNIQQFSEDGLSPKIASVEFSDTHLMESRAVQQHLPEIRGKAYSRMAIDIFLAEAIRPIYLQEGRIRARIGPAEVRLSGNPNQKLPDQIPIYVPCQPGPTYQWRGVEWTGNQAVSTITLTNALGVKPAEAVNGMNIEAGWDRVKEAYGHLGYIEAKLNVVPIYDDQSHTVSYVVSVNEGSIFKFNAMTITGMSLAGERMIRDAWPIKPGEVFDIRIFDQFLNKLELHRDAIFRDLPIHYDNVGHFLQTDPAKSTVDVLLDFK